MLGLILDNLIPIAMAAVAAVFGGFFYRKGRKHAKAKSDRELFKALSDVKESARDARSAGDSAGSDKLRDDDGLRRDD